MKNHFFKPLLITFSLLLFINCEYEPVEIIEEQKAPDIEIITKISELYELISKVTKEDDDPTKAIACLDFIYQFTIIIYDSNLAPIYTKVISGDLMFSNFLATLPANQSISLSYPILTTYPDGTIFAINSNSELQFVLDSCSKEDIINYCNNLVSQSTTCVWNVSYKDDYNNKYAGGFFESNSDGTVKFRYEDESYNGTWIFLYINNKLHMNINLEGSSEIATYWNINREIILEYQQSITILNNPKKIFLKRHCGTTQQYTIGEQGPAGGIVFYDKGSYSLGWRYLEASPEDLTFFEWGCMNSDINNTDNSSIGKGLLNSVLITNFHDNLNNFYTNPGVCNILNNGTLASKETLLLKINNFDDWFLPSKEELNKMYENLKAQNFGNLSDTKYWSSSQIDESTVHAIDFNNGLGTIESKVPLINNINTRAVRYF